MKYAIMEYSKKMHNGKREIQVLVPFISVVLEKRLLGMLCGSA